MKGKEGFKIRIIQRWIPDYRMALLRGVGSRYPGSVEVWAAKEDLGVSVIVPAVMCDYSHYVTRWGPLQWQHSVSAKGLMRGDVLVICGDIHNISVLIAALVAKARGVGVVWWGHHASANANLRKVKIRIAIAKILADVFLCYTQQGVEYLTKRGVRKDRVFATGNTIDTDSIKIETTKFLNNSMKSFQMVNNLKGKRVLAFCGSLRLHTGLELLIKALKTLNCKDNSYHLVVIGDGAERLKLSEYANSIGSSHFITWTGDLRGQDKVAPWLLSSDLFVYPGRVGLSIVHAMAYGLPAILNDNSTDQGPEYTVFEPDVMGYTFREGDDKDLAAKIAKAYDSGRLKEMGLKAREKIMNEYSMSQMIDRFCNAIEIAHGCVLGNNNNAKL